MYGENLKWFDRQQPALDHCVVADGEDNGCFVMQKFSGIRRFVVSPYKLFCQKYLKIDEDACHFYEIIRVNEPCRLYFDIDVDQTRKFTACGSILVDLLTSYVNHCLNVMYKRVCNRHQILILDSSTSTKFSQHVIYPDVIFRSNTECGNFVKTIMHAAWTRIEENEECELTRGFSVSDLEWLFLDNDDSTSNFVSDVTVYTKNRHFRIWRSSKLEKKIPLKVAPENRYPLLSEEQTFRDSMVIPPPRAHFDPQFLEFAVKPRIKGPREIEGSATSSSNAKTSSNPSLDRFVLQHIRSNPLLQHVDIDQVKEYSDGRSIVYDINGSRWCMNVQREHSKNRPFYCVNIEKGLLYQMCNSLPCEGFQSTSIKVPRTILEK